jgi:hypothetical protein
METIRKRKRISISSSSSSSSQMRELQTRLEALRSRFQTHLHDHSSLEQCLFSLREFRTTTPLSVQQEVDSLILGWRTTSSLFYSPTFFIPFSQLLLTGMKLHPNHSSLQLTSCNELYFIWQTARTLFDDRVEELKVDLLLGIHIMIKNHSHNPPVLRCGFKLLLKIHEDDLSEKAEEEREANSQVVFLSFLIGLHFFDSTLQTKFLKLLPLRPKLFLPHLSHLIVSVMSQHLEVRKIQNYGLKSLLLSSFSPPLLQSVTLFSTLLKSIYFLYLHDLPIQEALWELLDKQLNKDPFLNFLEVFEEIISTYSEHQLPLAYRFLDKLLKFDLQRRLNERQPLKEVLRRKLTLLHHRIGSGNMESGNGLQISVNQDGREDSGEIGWLFEQLEELRDQFPVRKLKVGIYQMTSKTLSKLCCYISGNPSELQQLEFSWNSTPRSEIEIGQSLGRALSSNKTLLELELSCVHLQDELELLGIIKESSNCSLYKLYIMGGSSCSASPFSGLFSFGSRSYRKSNLTLPLR